MLLGCTGVIPWEEKWWENERSFCFQSQGKNWECTLNHGSMIPLKNSLPMSIAE
jgi:hypothetical protein